MAPPSLFIGQTPIVLGLPATLELDWQAALTWAAIGFGIGFIYAALFIKAWTWLLSKRGQVDPEEQAIDDRDQARQLAEWLKKHKPR